MELLGEAAPGRSTGEAMSLMENLASQLPNGIGYDWTGMSYQERLSGNQAAGAVRNLTHCRFPLPCRSV